MFLIDLILTPAVIRTEYFILSYIGNGLSSNIIIETRDATSRVNDIVSIKYVTHDCLLLMQHWAT